MSFRFWRKAGPADEQSKPPKPLLSAEEAVDACYRAILGRDPDAGGRAEHVATLARDPARLPEMMRAFLASPESARTNAALLSRGSAEVTVPVVSLGTHCFASEFLQRLGLRDWAGPFDWIFSNIRMVDHCIRDDFATFLDRAEYEPVPLEQRAHGHEVNRVDHRFYRSKFGVKCVFNHHDVHEDTDYAYITRCVERFRAALKSSQPSLFVLFNRAQPGSVDQLRALDETFRQAGGQHRLLALLVDDKPAKRLVPEARVELETGTLTALHYASVSAWQPLSFADPIDEIVLGKLLRDAAARVPGEPPERPAS